MVKAEIRTGRKVITEGDKTNADRGVGCVMKGGILLHNEPPTEVRLKFIELLGRAPHDKIFDSGITRVSETGKKRGKIIYGDREFIKSEDTVTLSFAPSERKPNGFTITLEKAKDNQRGIGGKREVQDADPTWKQIKELKEKLGVFPKYIIWRGLEVRAVDDGYDGNSEIAFERGIPFELIELAVLEEAQKFDSSYREKYLSKMRKRI